MEISMFYKLISANYRLLIKYSSISTFLFLGLFFLTPEKFITEGTLFVYPVSKDAQNSEVSPDMNFARNLIGISESPEFRNIVSSRVNLSNSFLNFDSSIKIKEVTPNLISLSVWDTDSKNSFQKYSLYKATLIEFSSNLKKGSSMFEVTGVSNEPISYKVEKNLFLYLFVGLVSGFSTGITYLYLRKKND